MGKQPTVEQLERQLLALSRSRGKRPQMVQAQTAATRELLRAARAREKVANGNRNDPNEAVDRDVEVGWLKLDVRPVMEHLAGDWTPALEAEETAILASEDPVEAWKAWRSAFLA